MTNEENRKINNLNDQFLKEKAEQSAKFESEKRSLTSKLEELTESFNREKQESASLKLEKENTLRTVDQLRSELQRIQDEFKELNNDKVQAAKDITHSSMTINELRN